MLLMVERGILGGIYQVIHQHAKANNKHIKYYDKNKESSCLRYWNVNNLYVWAVLRMLPVNSLNGLKN